MRHALLFVLLLIASAVAFATPPAVVVAVGTDSAGVSYTLIQSYDGQTCTQTFGRAYSDSAGRSGCWTADNGYRRYVLAQRTPVAGFRFLPYSQTVTCPPDTHTTEACVAQ